MKTLQQHCPSKEPITEANKVVTPTSMVLVKTKVVEKEPETPKTKSSNPSPKRVTTKKVKKEPTPKSSTERMRKGPLNMWRK